MWISTSRSGSWRQLRQTSRLGLRSPRCILNYLGQNTHLHRPFVRCAYPLLKRPKSHYPHPQGFSRPPCRRTCTRGLAASTVWFEELASYVDSTGYQSGEAVYRALAPSVWAAAGLYSSTEAPSGLPKPHQDDATAGRVQHHQRFDSRQVQGTSAGLPLNPL